MDALIQIQLLIKPCKCFKTRKYWLWWWFLFCFCLFFPNDMWHLLFTSDIHMFFLHLRVSLQVLHSFLLSKMYSFIKGYMQCFVVKLVVVFFVGLTLTCVCIILLGIIIYLCSAVLLSSLPFSLQQHLASYLDFTSYFPCNFLWVISY